MSEDADFWAWMDENYRPNFEDPMTTYLEVWRGAVAHTVKALVRAKTEMKEKTDD